jgi:hypothetical protein
VRRIEWRPGWTSTTDEQTAEGVLPRVKRWGGICLVAAALVVGSLLGGASAHGSTEAAPANDNFANAIVLTGTTASRSGDTNVDATLEAGEPNTIPADGFDIEALHSIWYRWTPQTDGQVTVTTEGSEFDTLLAVYTGSSVNALTLVASNDDAVVLPTPYLTSSVTFNVTATTTYQIRVDGFGQNTGPVAVNLNELPHPPNDNFMNASPLVGSTVSVSDSNVAATLEPGEAPKVANTDGGASVWYSWAAPATGSVTIDTATSNFDTLLGVYTGTTVNALSEVASNDDVATPTDKTSSVTFPATSGTTYRIRVDGFQGAVGTIHLHLVLKTVPDAPTGVTPSAGDSQATLSWTAPASNGGSAITGYDVTRYVGGTAQGVTSVGAVTQATVTGLSNGTTYTFRVAAKNAIGTGPQSAESTPVTPKTVPGTPTSVTASASDAQAALSWSAPVSDGGSAITGYDVTPYAGGVAQGTTSVGVVTQTTVTGLTNGTAYTFRVAAKNLVGTGLPSAESNSVTPTAPPVVARRFALTITKSGTGSGTVTSNVGGINCGGTCTGDFDAATVVSLTATPDGHSTFSGWSGACSGSGQCSVTMDAAKTAVANFNQVLTPPPAVSCVVPKVKGKPLATAKKRIVAAHCGIGKITTARSKTVAKGRVISQSPKPGTRLRAGSKVKLVVSRGKR